MNTLELTRFIKTTALSLGFQKVGIIPAQALTPEDQWLKQWLASGYQADMAWMVNHLDKRENPATLMDGAQSVVCVAMNYFTPETENPHPDAVKIARYARGTDYHYVLKDRLKALLKAIQEENPEIQGRAFTDSAPLMEKAMAVRAGIGWQGKNSNILTRELGSWIFLGELLLSEVLDYDQPQPQNLCGTCTRCISACPTEAIPQAGVVDANKCISYWTIEFKGEHIPNHIAQHMEGWVFGCDICQDVCPWNIRFAQESQEEAFQPRPWNRQPSAQEILALDDETFAERYRKSPIKRTKRSGLQRNVQAYLTGTQAERLPEGNS